jgi:hypothetical protein
VQPNCRLPIGPHPGHIFLPSDGLPCDPIQALYFPVLLLQPWKLKDK